MNSISTPNNIEVLLHFYTRQAPHPRRDAGAVMDAITDFLEIDVLATTSEKDVYEVTSRGRAWIQAICDTPPPKTAWVDGNGKVIKV